MLFFKVIYIVWILNIFICIIYYIIQYKVKFRRVIYYICLDNFFRDKLVLVIGFLDEFSLVFFSVQRMKIIQYNIFIDIKNDKFLFLEWMVNM